MAKKNARNTRSRIVNAAWKLFYEQGYEDTTVEEIIDVSHTSKGSFYHYFDGKDALLGTLSSLFDEKYQELSLCLEEGGSAMEKLLFLNRELFGMIENSVSVELLARLLSTQLVTNGEKHLLDRNRTYYKLLRRIIGEGVEAGEPPEELAERCALPGLLRFFEDNGAEAVVLGCTHFPYVRKALQKRTALPVIDPAQRLLELVLGKKTS